VNPPNAPPAVPVDLAKEPERIAGNILAKLRRLLADLEALPAPTLATRARGFLQVTAVCPGPVMATAVRGLALAVRSDEIQSALERVAKRLDRL